MSIKHIAIAGHIGVGKSSLTKLLSDSLGIPPFHEPNLHNPFLIRFYADMSQWAFHSQVFFLVNKFNAHRKFILTQNPMIQDRTIYEDAEIFAEHLCQNGCMNPDEYQTYSDLYNEFIQLLPAPDLMIYMRADVDILYDRIKNRGRVEEQDIPREYMESLYVLYESWFERYDRSPKIVLEVNEMDFVNHQGDREWVVKHVRSQIATLSLLPEEPSPHQSPLQS
jgi:deoxyadenosine/deoxycytidine kinase